MTNQISQTDQILIHLQAGNALTPLEALCKFNCLREWLTNSTQSMHSSKPCIKDVPKHTAGGVLSW